MRDQNCPEALERTVIFLISPVRIAEHLFYKHILEKIELIAVVPTYLVHTLFAMTNLVDVVTREL